MRAFATAQQPSLTAVSFHNLAPILVTACSPKFGGGLYKPGATSAARLLICSFDRKLMGRKGRITLLHLLQGQAG
eukprot:1158028-Pelagomonas_calceolata.AAC.10